MENAWENVIWLMPKREKNHISLNYSYLGLRLQEYLGIKTLYNTRPTNILGSCKLQFDYFTHAKLKSNVANFRSLKTENGSV